MNDAILLNNVYILNETLYANIDKENFQKLCHYDAKPKKILLNLHFDKKSREIHATELEVKSRAIAKGELVYPSNENSDCTMEQKIKIEDSKAFKNASKDQTLEEEFKAVDYDDDIEPDLKETYKQYILERSRGES